jgi:hypothetical protein
MSDLYFIRVELRDPIAGAYDLLHKRFRKAHIRRRIRKDGIVVRLPIGSYVFRDREGVMTEGDLADLIVKLAKGLGTRVEVALAETVFSRVTSRGLELETVEPAYVVTS